MLRALVLLVMLLSACFTPRAQGDARAQDEIGDSPVDSARLAVLVARPARGVVTKSYASPPPFPLLFEGWSSFAAAVSWPPTLVVMVRPPERPFSTGIDDCDQRAHIRRVRRSSTVDSPS